MADPVKLGDKESVPKMAFNAPAIATAGSDPVSNFGTTLYMAGQPGGPWGATQYGDPGALVLPKDASQMPSLEGSEAYQALLQSMAANRGRTDAGTAAQLRGQPNTDPYAASRENALAGTKADVGHDSYIDQQQMLVYRQNQALQDYLEEQAAYQAEQDRRNKQIGMAANTASNAVKLIADYYTKGAASKAGKGSGGNMNKYGGVGTEAYGPKNEGA